MVKKVIVDGTERPICRPKDREQQKENYSGKKKRHTSKNLAAIAENKRILVLSPTSKGKTHEKKYTTARTSLEEYQIQYLF